MLSQPNRAKTPSREPRDFPLPPPEFNDSVFQFLTSTLIRSLIIASFIPMGAAALANGTRLAQLCLDDGPGRPGKLTRFLSTGSNFSATHARGRFARVDDAERPGCVRRAPPFSPSIPHAAARRQSLREGFAALARQGSTEQGGFTLAPRRPASGLRIASRGAPPLSFAHARGSRRRPFAKPVSTKDCSQRKCAQVVLLEAPCGHL